MSKVSVGNLSAEVMRCLSEYGATTSSGVKEAVNKAGKTIKDEIKSTAPSDTGAYAKSWSVRKESESSTSLHLTIFSKGHAWLAHLLENGHGLHQGGRTRAFPHIGPAEELGVEQLEADIERCIKDG